jgi:hypothetical protein
MMISGVLLAGIFTVIAVEERSARQIEAGFNATVRDVTSCSVRAYDRKGQFHSVMVDGDVNEGDSISCDASGACSIQVKP